MSLENAKKFLEDLDTNEEAMAKLKESGKDLDESQEISLFGTIARESGYDTTDEELEEILKRVRDCVAATSDQTAKDLDKLPREELDHVAGGKDHDRCEDTYKDSDNCWITDKCKKVILAYPGNYYRDLETGEIIYECKYSHYCKKIMYSPDCTFGRLINHI